MTLVAFTYKIFLENSLQMLTYFALMMALASLWIKRTAWLWGAFLAISIAAGVETKTLEPLGVLFLAFLFVCHLVLIKDSRHTLRFFFFLAITALSSGLWLHLLPGFHNWKVAPNLQISSGASPYALWLNFDKPWIGLFPLALSLPLVHTRESFKRLWKITLPVTLLAIILLLFLAVKLQLVHWDPKLPAILPLWMLVNLFFVAIPEEAFARGFIQTEICRWLGPGFFAKGVSILAAALFFTLLHIPATPHIAFLSLVFATGLFCGFLYQVTGMIESGIVCHFGINLAHFTLFTYPVTSG